MDEYRDPDDFRDYEIEVQHGRPFVVREGPNKIVVGVPLDPAPSRVWRVLFFHLPGAHQWRGSYGVTEPKIVGPEMELTVQPERLEDALNWCRTTIAETNRVLREDELPREIESRAERARGLAEAAKRREEVEEQARRRQREIEERLRQWHEDAGS